MPDWTDEDWVAPAEHRVVQSRVVETVSMTESGWTLAVRTAEPEEVETEHLARWRKNVGETAVAVVADHLTARKKAVLRVDVGSPVLED